MKKIICKLIWEASEFSGIPLGRFAPVIFGGMIGAKRKEIKIDKNVE